MATPDSSTGPNAKRRRVGAKAATKPRAKAKASAGQAEDMTSLAQAIPPESDLGATTVSCAWGVRNKLWIDDVVACVNHTISSLSAELKGAVDEQVFTETKRELIRLALIFAFTGQITLATHKTPSKTYKKWSSVRPALRGHAVLLLTKAHIFFL